MSDKAATFATTGTMNVFDAGPSISKSDLTSIRNGLKTIVQGMVKRTDWKLREGDQILNIVHPSLYPLAYETTYVLPRDKTVNLDCLWEIIGRGRQSAVAPHLLEEIFRCGGKDASRAPEILRDRGDEVWLRDPLLSHRWHEDKPWRYSTRFQWLPCDVKLVGREDDGQVKIDSYVNGLHPTTAQPYFYQAIEGVLSASIQPWSDIIVHGTPRWRKWQVALY